jgi:pyridoxamine 5'-phosphate oxidase family protein
MSAFTEKELEYLRGQRLGRLATVDSSGNPHVVPVGFRYNPGTDTIDIGGRNVAATAKWTHAERHPRVAFVVDDVLPPWQPRSILVNADVELLQESGHNMGRGFAPELMRLHPVKIISWGIEAGKRSSRQVELQG